MKKTLQLIAILICFNANSQTYTLVPDSCTFCFYKNVDDFGNITLEHYGIDPSIDTLVIGNQYKKLISIDLPSQPFAVRQIGNKMFGVVQDSIQEYLIMDFDANVGDSILNLYSEGYFYNAIVTQQDSILVNSGVYHHQMRLSGINILINGIWENQYWSIKWNERGLCISDIIGFGDNYGGMLYNSPFDQLFSYYNYNGPSYCTTDPIYTNQNGNTCDNCIPVSGILSSSSQLSKTEKTLVRTVNVLGQEVGEKPFTLLINIYGDGSTEKTYIVD